MPHYKQDALDHFCERILGGHSIESITSLKYGHSETGILNARRSCSQTLSSMYRHGRTYPQQWARQGLGGEGDGPGLSLSLVITNCATTYRSLDHVKLSASIRPGVLGSRGLEPGRDSLQKVPPGGESQLGGCRQ